MRPSRRASAGADAEVDAVAERHVVVEAAVDVEAVGVGVLALVAPGRPGEQQHLREPAGIGGAVELDVGVRPSALHRRRRLVAQELLDGVRDQRRVGGELGALVGVRGEHHAGPPEQPGHGLGAGADEQVGEVARLVVGEPPDLAVLGR